MGEQTKDGPFSGFQCVSLAMAVHGTLFIQQHQMSVNLFSSWGFLTQCFSGLDISVWFRNSTYSYAKWFFFLITVSHKNILRPQNLMVLILWISQDTNKKKRLRITFIQSQKKFKFQVWMKRVCTFERGQSLPFVGFYSLTSYSVSWLKMDFSLAVFQNNDNNN